jgi:23S rRNA pseudouridine1911/1915/1917 synthase
MQNKLRVVVNQSVPDRLDKYLVGLRIQELYSRTFIEKLIDEDRILVME